MSASKSSLSNRVRFGLAALLIVLAACGSPAPPTEIQAELLSTWEPTPYEVVRKMLDMAEVQQGELLYDLGSGDGRIVITAAEEYKVQSFGFEIDPELVASSQESIRGKGLEALAQVQARDLMTADYSQPDVITCYLTPEGLEKVTPKLEAEMKPGSRLVAYKFPIPGWEPDETATMQDDDPEIPLHEVFLYRRNGPE